MQQIHETRGDPSENSKHFRVNQFEGAFGAAFANLNAARVIWEHPKRFVLLIHYKRALNYLLVNERKRDPILIPRDQHIQLQPTFRRDVQVLLRELAKCYVYRGGHRPFDFELD